MIAIYAGLRRGEILNLKWINIDFDNKIIHLPYSITKCNKERIIYIPDILIDYLKSYKESKNADEDEYVIIYKDDKINNIKRLWTTFRKKLSFQKLSNGLILHFHDLRHVYGQILKDSGIPMADIQHQMGHSSVSTTEKHYTQLPSIYLKDKF